jgi:hypothetical protein
MGLLSLIFKLGTDNTDLERGLDAAKARIKKASEDMHTSMGEGFATSQPMSLQKLEAQGKLVGVSIEQQASAYKKLAVEQGHALAGSKESQQAFEGLGVTLTDLQKMDPAQIFQRIRESLGGAQPNARQMADLVKVTGKSADELLPLLKASGDQFVMTASNDAVRNLDSIGDSWTIIKANIKGAGLELASFMADMLGINKLSDLLAMRSKDDIIRHEALPEAANLTRQRKEQARQEQEAIEKEKELQAKAEAADRKGVGERNSKLFERLGDRQEKARIDAMSPEERRQDIMQQLELNRHNMELTNPAGAVNELEADRSRGEQARLQLEKFDLEDALKNLDKFSRIDTILKPQQGDSLVNVGNFLGSDPAQKQTSLLSEISDGIERLETQLKDLNSGKIVLR